ncbi:MAG: hypothetical protein WC335_08260 [Candidatus Omnitrophota bacterium]|jgi:predicted transcriptional regulator
MKNKNKEKTALEEVLAEVQNQMRRNNAAALKAVMRRLVKKETRKPA